MARRVKYTDEMIVEAAKALKADKKDISPWAVRVAMGGGKISRIEQVLAENEVMVIDAEPVVIEQVLSLPSQFVPQVEQAQENYHTLACEMWRLATEIAENRVRDEFVAANQAKDKALSEMAAAKQVCDTLEDDITMLTSERDSLQEDQVKLLAEQQEYKQKIAAQDAENRSLNTQLAEFRKMIEELEHKLENQRAATAEAVGRYNELHANAGEAVKLKTKVAGLEARVDDRNITIKKNESAIAELRETNKGLVQQVGQLKGELKVANQRGA